MASRPSQTPNRPSVSGDLLVMRCVDLLAWLERRKPDGMLRFHSSDRRIEKRFVVRGDAVVASTSSDPREFLGQFLVNFGYVTEEQLQGAFAQQDETRAVLGRVLTLGGLCTEEQITRALALKLRESLFDVLLWERGTFDFTDGALGSNLIGKLRISLPLADLTADAELRAERWAQVREVFSDTSVTCKLRRDRIPPAIWTTDEHRELRALLEALEGGATIDDVLLQRHSTTFPLLDWLFDLYLQDFLVPNAAINRPAPETPTPLDTRRLHDILKQLSNGDFQSAADALWRAGSVGPGDQRALNLLRRAEDGITTALRSQYENDKRTPSLDGEMTDERKAELTANERYLVDRIDGKWSVSDLIRVSPIGEADALRVIRNLERNAIIKFETSEIAAETSGR